MEKRRVSKIEAASRQADAAIKLFFDGGDIVAVHTLAGAAANIASDLIGKISPATSLDRQTQIASGLDAKTYFKAIRATQNFLKHAKDDPDAVHEFTIAETTSLLATASVDIGNLTGSPSLPQAIFCLWHISCYLDVIDLPSEPRALVERIFGDLSRCETTSRLLAGRKKLDDMALGLALIPHRPVVTLESTTDPSAAPPTPLE